MAITTKWSVNNMTHNDADGGVILVYWSCTAQADTGESAVEAGKLRCEPDPSSEGYVPYAELTEETVLGWVKSALNETEETVEVIETRLTGKVEKQLSPEVVSAVPDGFYPAEEVAA
jgi:hypothetical protein